ncbi:MAG: MATE family efflux transporter [Oscillospiraceae bacterium]|nr:MATE family efflux transporter [Oscillospiraceae bacterium]
MKTDVFETMSVPKAVAKLALPTVLGMLVQIIYNMADTVYIGWLNDENQMAAVTLAMPFFTFLMALASIFGIGGGSYISRLLGVKDYKRVKKTSSFSFYACIALGLICTGAGLLFMEPILTLLGAKQGTTMGYAYDYSFWVLLGSPIVMLSFSLGQIVRAEGASGISMIGMTIGGVLNIVLDPIMIFAMHMGVVGAAIATVLGNVFAVLFYLWYLLFRSKHLTISPKYMIPDSHELKNILMIGIPASLNSMLMCISNIIQNNLAAGYGAVELSSIGVILKVNMFPVFILIGLCQGVQPLIGYNYSANNRKRLSSVMKFTGVVATIVAILFTIVIFFGSDYFVSLIMSKPEIVELGSRYLKYIMLSVPFLGLLFLLTNAFQGMGKSIPAMVLSISRQGFVFIPVIFAANALFGCDGIVFAQPIADIVSVIMSAIMFFVIWKKEHPHHHPETPEKAEA